MEERLLAVFFILEAGTLADGVEQDIVRITTSFPHGEATEVVVLDEVALSSERRGIVEGNHDFGSLVVNIRL